MANIKINLLNAILTHDTQIGSLMDPFVIFKINNEQLKSTLLQEGGDMPQWNETFQFKNVKEEDLIQVVVYDQDLTYDDVVGQVQIEVKQIISLKRIQPKWYSLKFQKKPAGKIKLGFQVMNMGQKDLSLPVNHQLNYGKNIQNQQLNYMQVNQYNNNIVNKPPIIINRQSTINFNIPYRSQKINNFDVNYATYQNNTYRPVQSNQPNYMTTSSQTLRKPEFRNSSTFLSPTNSKMTRTLQIIYSNVHPNNNFINKLN